MGSCCIGSVAVSQAAWSTECTIVKQCLATLINVYDAHAAPQSGKKALEALYEVITLDSG